MFVVNDDMSIYVTRGDTVYLKIKANKNGASYTFRPGEVLRIKVFEKKNCEKVVLQKDFPITAVTQGVEAILDGNDTKIGGVISKPTDYWYEVELNPDTNPQTIIGYDEDGPRLFRLYPEGKDKPEIEPDPEVIKVIDDELDMTSDRPVKNQVIARAFANLQGGFQAVHDAVAEKFVTPQMFGAIGDGVADDTEAIRLACNSGMSVVLNKNYSLTGTIDVQNKITIESGAVVYIDSDIDAFAMNGENLIICGDGKIQVRVENYSHVVVTMGGGCKRCAVDGVSINGISPYKRYGTAVACNADTARLYLNKIHASIENFDIGILLNAENHWLNCFDIKSGVSYCNIGVKQIGNYENGYHYIDITGQACFYTENGCGLYCDENGGKCHYRLNIVDTGRTEGGVKYNTILAIIKSDNNCIEIPYASYGIYLKNEGRKNRFINEPEYTIAASDNILNNIDGETWCTYEPINLDSLTGTNLFSYPKAKNTADYMLRYTPTSDNDGARITLNLPRAINPTVLGIVCPMNYIPKRIAITLVSDNGTETVEIPSQVYEEGVFLPLTRYFTWKPLYQTTSITIECYGSNRGYGGQGAGLVGLMLNDVLLGGNLA